MSEFDKDFFIRFWRNRSPLAGFFGPQQPAPTFSVPVPTDPNKKPRTEWTSRLEDEIRVPPIPLKPKPKGLLPAGCETVDDALRGYSEFYERQLMQSFFWPYIGATEAIEKQFRVLKHMVWRDARRADNERH
jgi:hypothetical protein